VSTQGKHEVKQGARQGISNMNSPYFFLAIAVAMRKFTFWCAEVATTIINTSQPPPPVSTRGPPQVIHRLHTGAELSTGLT